MNSAKAILLVIIFLALPFAMNLDHSAVVENDQLNNAQIIGGSAYAGEEWCGEDTTSTDYKILCPDMPTIFGDPVVTLSHSEHFVIRASYDDTDLLNSHRQDGMPLSQENQDGVLSRLEEIWQKFIVDINFSAPYESKALKYKTNVIITDYGYLSGGTFDEGIPGGPHPFLQVQYGATEGYGGLAHEFTHALQNMALGSDWFEYGGWFSESHAEFMAAQVTGEVGCTQVLVDSPQHHYGTTRNRYCNWQFWEFLAEEHGFDAVNKIWSSSINGPEFMLNGATELPDECEKLDGPFAALLRIMNWTVEDLNDFFGLWAMANVGWDYDVMGETFRDAYGNTAERSLVEAEWGRLTRLELVNNGEPHYAPPDYIAPQRWGYNLVQLFPESGASSIDIEFRGVVQNESARTEPFGAFNKEPFRELSPDSGWRWGVVAIQADGTTRHSPLMSGAEANISFQTLPDDDQTYMVVVGAPTTLHQIRWDQPHYSIYRYPWRIQIEGALPDGSQDRLTSIQSEVSGAFHQNGGGFVADTATVATTAYVGPNAVVLGTSQVLDNARIEDRVTIFDRAVISGNAVVRDHARVGGEAQIYGNATIHDSAQIWGGSVYENARVGAITWLVGETEVYGNAIIESTNIERPIQYNAHIYGTVQLLGDVEFSVEDISSGVWYGFVHPEFMGIEEWGAFRTIPEVEVTMSAANVSWSEYTTSSGHQSTTHHEILQQCIGGTTIIDDNSTDEEDNHTHDHNDVEDDQTDESDDDTNHDTGGSQEDEGDGQATTGTEDENSVDDDNQTNEETQEVQDNLSGVSMNLFIIVCCIITGGWVFKNYIKK